MAWGEMRKAILEGLIMIALRLTGLHYSPKNGSDFGVEWGNQGVLYLGVGMEIDYTRYSLPIIRRPKGNNLIIRIP